MSDTKGGIPGIAEAGIRAAIDQLQLLLPERSIVVRDLWRLYFASLPPDQEWVRCVGSMMIRVMTAKVDGDVCLGDVQVMALRPSHWTTYRNGPGQSLSPTTRNLQLTRLKAMVSWAVTDGLIYDSPIRRMKREKARGHRRTEISEDDDERVADKLPLAVSVLFQVQMGTGMRIGEVRQLRWDQIDLEAKTIFLAWDESKGRKAETISLTQAAADALRLMPRVPGSPYVFVSDRTGRPLTYTHFWSFLRGAFDDLGLKAAPGDGRVHPHDTRHSVASRLNRRGAKLTDIQGILRHTNLAQTAQYIHTRAEEIAAAAALLELPRKGPRRAPARAATDAAPAQESAVG